MQNKIFNTSAVPHFGVSISRVYYNLSFYAEQVTFYARTAMVELKCCTQQFALSNFFLYRFEVLTLLFLSLLPLSTLCCRETTDSYTISMSPNFGFLSRSPSIIYSSYDSDFTKSNIDAGSRSPLLTEESKHPREEDVISRAQSSYSAKSSFHRQITGELPISHGCSFTQTVFNGPLH